MRHFIVFLACSFVFQILSFAAPLQAEVAIELREGWVGGVPPREPPRRYSRRHRRPEYVIVPAPQPPAYYYPNGRQTLYAPPAPADNSRHDLIAVNDRLYAVRHLLSEKLDQEAITQTQYDAVSREVAQLDQEGHSQEYNNGGYITGDQQTSLLQQADQIAYAISQNLVVR